MKDNEIEIAKIYLDEWMHRDNMLVKYTFSFFTADLVVSLLPYVKFQENNLLDILEPVVFPCAGMLLSIVSLFVVYVMGKRLSQTGLKYRKALGDYIPNRKHKFVLSKILPPFMFLLLIALDVVLIWKSI